MSASDTILGPTGQTVCATPTAALEEGLVVQVSVATAAVQENLSDVVGMGAGTAAVVAM